MSTDGGPPLFRVGAVVSRSLALFSTNLIPFLTLAALIYSPTLLFPSLYDVDAGGTMGTSADLGLKTITSLAVYCLVYLLSTAVIVHAVVQSLRGRPIRLVASLQAALRRAVPLVLMLTVSMLAILLGFMLFLLPGFILIAVWLVAVPCCVVEGHGAMASLGRSRDLTGGRLGPVFGIVMLFYAASLAFGLGLGWLQAYFLEDLAYLLFSFLLDVVLVAFYAVLVAVTYHDLRVAKEGVDIEEIAAMFE